ncbi:CMSS1 [Micractinium conductrix]|uniref:CMSS1 n=1 Tax=Micractinium conductrix TaxID=554055 RepID=A0A2P6VRU2_9CHLO|nr:CMSS1 [Micractinium conductrix]|eukprot:PSC76809.1 CMSS1 [Micractinium conductrix]
MQDYKPPADSGDEGGDDAAADVAAGSGGSDGEAADAAAGGSKAAKPRRKRGQKLSSLEFEASRQMARQIGECSAEDQADWLWSSFQQHAAASGLERGGLAESGVAALPAQGSLEERLKGLAAAGGWQAAFCSREGPAGAPALLLVSPSAIGAVNLIKLCPQFNRACRIGKLFAKHFKVAEQEEALRSQVMCIAAGTPNRLCKLADGGALRLDRLAHVVLDVQLDVKQRDLLSIPETRADWWTFYERHLKQRVDAGSLKLSLVNSDRLA